jgi:hypothetical protein
VDGIALPNSSYSSTYGGVIDFPNTGLDKNDFQKHKNVFRPRRLAAMLVQDGFHNCKISFLFGEKTRLLRLATF